MFGRSKPVRFDPYGSRRSRWRLPRWLVLLLTGAGLGAAGVIFVQERYLPPRLSANDSVRLQRAFDQSEAARLALKSQLDQSSKRLATALAENTARTEELRLTRSGAEQLRNDLEAVVAALPPDPRDGSVGVRAARFTTSGPSLSYDVVLTRERSPVSPLTGVMQLVVTGEAARGSATAVTLKPVPVSITGHQVVRGSAILPMGFRPQQTSIQLLDRPGGRLLGSRVILVKAAP